MIVGCYNIYYTFIQAFTALKIVLEFRYGKHKKKGEY